MIEEVRKYVGKHHETANQPHLAHADSTQPRNKAGRAACFGRTDVQDCRCLQRHAEFVGVGWTMRENETKKRDSGNSWLPTGGIGRQKFVLNTVTKYRWREESG